MCLKALRHSPVINVGSRTKTWLVVKFLVLFYSLPVCRWVQEVIRKK